MIGGKAANFGVFQAPKPLVEGKRSGVQFSKKSKKVLREMAKEPPGLGAKVARDSFRPGTRF